MNEAESGNGRAGVSVDAAGSATAAEQLGFKAGDVIQEFGYDEDVDFSLRDSIEELTGQEILDQEDHDVVDAVLLWQRSDDEDLVDSLMDAIVDLDEGGVVWVFTPKSGRAGYVAPADIQEAAPTAGLHVTSTAGVSEDWAATRLVARRNNKNK